MKSTDAALFVCPLTKQPMRLEVDSVSGDNVIGGRLISPNGIEYPVIDGVPDLRYPREMPASDAAIATWYDANADIYDEFLPLTFQTFGEDEESVRAGMVDKLELTPTSRVLEIGAGTGRDSVVIASRLGEGGEFHLQDLCAPIFVKSFPKLRHFDVPVKFHLGNACSLPFPDDYFDACFHFGGLNTFSDIPGFFSEMNRVTKPGGKVVAGDESMPVWLRETEFGKILMHSNPHYRYDLPLEYLPVSCREVRLEWIIGGVFYVLDYRVGIGEPHADFDFEIPGARGGTHRTRYYGHLEGVTPEAIELARKARVLSGKSMHRWLDEVIKDAALRAIDKQGDA